jgi:hypothetical protein
MYNSVARRAASLVIAASFIVPTAPALAQTVKSDGTCTKVRQVFIGMNDIALKGNTKIIPFSAAYLASITSYFDRGCPRAESFPMPAPGTDMHLAATAGDIVVSGKIKFDLGKPLLR